MKNASLAGRPTVILPYSKVKETILECLKKEGYVAKFERKTQKDHPVLEVELSYTDERPKITEAERVSKQSKRVYIKVKDIHSVRGGTGILVLSTPKGILSGKDAWREKVGGEALFKLW